MLHSIRNQVSALSREAADAKEEEARAREALATHRFEAAAELDKASLAVREAEELERSVRVQQQVSPAEQSRAGLRSAAVCRCSTAVARDELWREWG